MSKKKSLPVRNNKPRSRGNGQGSLYQLRGRGSWMIAYFDSNGVRVRKSTFTKDKSIANRILDKCINQVVQEKTGLISPQDKRILTANEKSVLDHALDYIEFCKHGKENAESSQGVLQKEKHIQQWIQHCKLNVLSDISEQGLLDFLKYRQAHSKGRCGNKKTGNRVWNIVRSHVIVFTNWLLKNGKLRENPLRNIVVKPEQNDHRRQRRAFTNEEVKNLVKEAKTRGRELWYRCAAEIGLRKGDLTRLVWSNVVCTKKGSAFVRIIDQKSKDREDFLPISNSLAVLFQQKFKESGSKALERVFPQIVTDITRDKDFKRAGIVKTDSEGKVVDLHSFRMFLSTKLVTSGAPLATIQSLLRHKDIETTLKYYYDPNSIGSMKAKRKWLLEVNSKI